MKLVSIVLIASSLMNCATPAFLLSDTGVGGKAVERQLADVTAEEQKIIDFVMNTFEELIIPGTKAADKHLYFNQATNKLDEAVGKPPQHHYAEKHLATYYFKFDDNNSPPERKIKTPYVLFWVHVAQGGPKQTGETPKEGDKGATTKAAKKTTKDIVFEFTNGIVTSKIKVQYAFGGMELLKDFIRRSCFNFLLKVEQSVFGLVVVEPIFDSIASAIQDIFLADIDPLPPYTLAASLISKELHVADEKEKKVAIPETLPAIKKIVEGTIASMKKVDDKGGQPEHLIYEVKPTITSLNPDEQPDYATYIDVFHLLVLKVGSRILLMVHSKHFSDSIEVSVNSKQTIVDTAYNLLYKVIRQTYQNFLDLEPKGQTCANGVEYVKSKGIAKLGLEEGDANPAGQTTGEGEKKEDGPVASSVTHFKKELGGTNRLGVSLQVIDNADIKVVVQLFKVSQDGTTVTSVIRRQNYFPYVSQYCMGVFILSFIEKVKEDFADLAFSEEVRNPDAAKGEENKKLIGQNLGLKYNLPFSPDVGFTDANIVDLTKYWEKQETIEDCPERLNSVAPVAAAGKWQAHLCTLKTSKPKKVAIVLKAISG